MSSSQGPDKKLLDVTSLPITPKRVRPLAKQRPHESRRLWQHVTRALKQGNLQLATEQKKQVRTLPFKTKNFASTTLCLLSNQIRRSFAVGRTAEG